MQAKTDISESVPDLKQARPNFLLQGSGRTVLDKLSKERRKKKQGILVKSEYRPAAKR